MRARQESRSTRRETRSEEGSAEAPRHADALQRSMGNRAVQRLLAVQRRGAGRPPAYDASPGAIHEAARRGVRSAATALPFAAQIQRAFGGHDLGGVRAHEGPTAAGAAADMGASAYTTGEDIVFAGAPDLRTTAHEAAHAVQQRAGIQLPGGVGTEGDAYERHADEVADRVVAGQSAEDLLSGVGGGDGITTLPSVQRTMWSYSDGEWRPLTPGAAEPPRTVGQEGQWYDDVTQDWWEPEQYRRWALSRQEITTSWPDIAREEREDFTNVRMFLSDKERVAAALDELEGEMRRLATEGLRQDKPSRLLSTALSLDELRQGYNTSSPTQHAQTFLRIMKGDEFRAQIQDKRPWKDPTVGTTHGEYTHRIQWFAVAHGGLDLTRGVSDVFAEVGRYASPKPPRAIDAGVGLDLLEDMAEMTGVPADRLDLEDLGRQVHWGLWDVLCDRDAGDAAPIPFKALSPTDFSAPENLNMWLIESEEATQRFPLLRAALRGRKEKRDANDISVDMVGYTNRKLRKGAHVFHEVPTTLQFPTPLDPDELGGILRWPF